MMFNWKNKIDLEFTQVVSECPVCLEEDILMKFPSCSHCLCVQCTRKILFFDETRRHLNPVFYGCPPCPNGCQNPERGKQCHCEEQEEVQNVWEQEHPDEFKRWNDDEHDSINGQLFRFHAEDQNYGNCKCPICRSQYSVTN